MLRVSNTLSSSRRTVWAPKVSQRLRCAAGRHGMADVRGGRHCDPFRCLTPVLCIVIMRNSRYHPAQSAAQGRSRSSNSTTLSFTLLHTPAPQSLLPSDTPLYSKLQSSRPKATLPSSPVFHFSSKSSISNGNPNSFGNNNLGCHYSV